MLRNIYLYENTIFANKVKYSIVLNGKGKERLALIKSLTNLKVEAGLLGAPYKRSQRNLLF